MNLPEKIVALHRALEKANLPHAFGGALALAWCTRRARGTIDIDVNIFVDVAACQAVFETLPAEIKVTAKQRKALKTDGQVRVFWDRTPVDLFLNTTPFHNDAAKRVRWERFMDADIPFLACNDLAVFKTFFNRSQDWADLEAMQTAGTLNIEKVFSTISEYLGADDARLATLKALKS